MPYARSRFAFCARRLRPARVRRPGKTADLREAKWRCVGTVGAIRDFTTRRHYAGRHEVELIVNGRVVARSFFELAV
ncbi:TPA: hypothetical protein QDC03_003217 [Burkholderia cepacia]|uniref:hypothetical protein n=1 Tax=Burkholderia cepacia TaxID=292 RepID=UPI000CF84D56|nr:hypothetical protein [Burkholderia cepacia]HDR9508122.1 hypothetical protein [Burkholderia cepacia]